MSTTPTRVGLIFGGASGEHAVSIRSAATVASALAAGGNGSRYGVSCFYIDTQGRWWGPEVADAVLTQGTPASPGQLPNQGFPASPPALMPSTSGCRCCTAPMAKTAPSRACSP